MYVCVYVCVSACACVIWTTPYICVCMYRETLSKKLGHIAFEQLHVCMYVYMRESSSSQQRASRRSFRAAAYVCMYHESPCFICMYICMYVYASVRVSECVCLHTYIHTYITHTYLFDIRHIPHINATLAKPNNVELHTYIYTYIHYIHAYIPD
jgi:hypothetical protein